VVVCLRIMNGASEGQLVSLSKRQYIVLGRTIRADVMLKDDPRISSEHCRVENDGKVAFIKDLNSTNGTFLNGQRVRDATLNHQDKIRIGGTELEVLFQGAADVPPPKEIVDDGGSTDDAVRPKPTTSPPISPPKKPSLPSYVPSEIVKADEPRAGASPREFVTGSVSKSEQAKKVPPAPPLPVPNAPEPVPVEPRKDLASNAAAADAPSGSNAFRNKIPGSTQQADVLQKPQRPTVKEPEKPQQAKPNFEKSVDRFPKLDESSEDSGFLLPESHASSAVVRHHEPQIPEAPIPEEIVTEESGAIDSPHSEPVEQAEDDEVASADEVGCATITPDNYPEGSSCDEPEQGFALDGQTDLPKKIPAPPVNAEEIPPLPMEAKQYFEVKCSNGLMCFRSTRKEEHRLGFAPTSLVQTFASQLSTIVILHFQKANATTPDSLLDAAVPLIDWLPYEVAQKYGPIMVPYQSLVDSGNIACIDQLWDTDGCMVLLGKDLNAMTDHARALVHKNVQGISREGGMFLYCWPSVLSEILSSQTQETAISIMGGVVEGVLMELGSPVCGWNAFGTAEVRLALQRAGMTKVRPE
jgi:hypothetical protein